MSRVYPNLEKAYRPRYKELVAFLFIGSCFLSGYLLYRGLFTLHWDSSAVRTIANTVPIPVGKIEDEWIFYGEVLDLQAFTRIVSEEGEDAFSAALDTLLFQKYLEVFTASHDLVLESSQGWEQLDEETRRYYQEIGWGLEEYDTYIAKPLAMAQAVEDYFYGSQEWQSRVWGELEEIMNQLDRGVPFHDLALQYSDDPSKVIGGDIGYISKSDVDAELAPLFDLNVGEVSDVIELDYTLNLYLVTEILPDDDETIRVSKIEKTKTSFSELFATYRMNHPPKLWLN